MILLPVLNYHHVGVKIEPGGHHRLWVSVDRFAEHLEFLAQREYRCLSLRDCLPYLTGETPVPPRVVALSFDDGYSNFLMHAYPLLARYHCSATVAVVTGEIGGRSRWDQGSESTLMGWDDIVALHRAGIEIASHTESHPRLSQVSPNSLRNELQQSRRVLEDKLGIVVTSLVYPYGDVNADIERAAADAGYRLACSSARGNLHRPSQMFRLRRVPMDECVTIPRLRRRLSLIYHCTNVMQQISRRLRMRV